MIEIDDVGVSLGGRRIFDDVSVRVEEGELLGLIGPNGAGKTTLLRTISGLVTPETGQVRVQGASVAELDARTLGRRVAVVPQSNELGFDFTVREVVEMGRTPYLARFRPGDARGREAVERALERTATDHLADRHITAVSGGERKRVTIARAVAQETPILLLDEPTASLDINHQLATFELIEELVDDGKAGIAAVHDLDLAARYCDRVLLLADGAALAIGPPADVLTPERIRAAYGVRASVHEDPFTGTVSVTPVPNPSTESGVRVHVIGGNGAGVPVMRQLDRAGYDVSVGAIETGGPEHVLARAIDAPAVTVPPAAPIDEETYERNLEHVRTARVTVLADIDVGPLNHRNLRAAEAADAAVVVEERPFGDRNHAGPVEHARYERLRRRHPVVSTDELTGAVADRLVRGKPGEGATASTADGPAG